MKRYLWVVEYCKDGEWVVTTIAACSRNEARHYAQIWRNVGETVRIRKYIPEDK